MVGRPDLSILHPAGDLLWPQESAVSFNNLIKHSSLLHMITLIELTGAAKMNATRYFAYNETFHCAGVVYLALVTVMTNAVHLIGKKYAIPAGQAACSAVA